jgi:tetratricopeptide (TPR) repeat protein
MEFHPMASVRPLPAIMMAICALIMVLIVAYRAAPDNVFHLDDYSNIVAHGPIHITELTVSSVLDAARNAYLDYRPLPNITFAIDWWRGYGEPRAFQWTNLTIHGLNTLLVFVLLMMCLRRFRPEKPGWVAAAAFGAAFWAFHPIQVQGVTYIVQRMASMATFFTLLTVLAYLAGRWAQTSWRRAGWWGVAVLALIAGALSKEIAWMAPVLIILAELGVRRHDAPRLSKWWEWGLIFAPVIVLAIIVVDLTLIHGPFARFVHEGFAGRPFTMEERLLTQPRVLAFHMSQILWPWPDRFSIEHEFLTSTGVMSPPSTLFALLGVLAWCGAGLAALFIPRWRLAGFFILWTAASLAPESSIVPLEMVFEHRAYLPMIGLGGLAALGVQELLNRGTALRKIGIAVIIAVPLALAFATDAIMPAWADAVEMERRSIKNAPNSYRAWTNLGFSLLLKGQFAEAKPALQRALELDPLQENARIYLSIVMLDEGDLAGADILLSGMEKNAHISRAAVNTLGELRLKQDRPEEAARYFKRAVDMADWYPLYRWNLAVALEKMNNCRDARHQWETFLKLRPAQRERRMVLDHLHEIHDTPGGPCYAPPTQGRE